MKYTYLIFAFALILMSCDSCTNDKKVVQQMTQAQIDSMLIAQNKNFHVQEMQRIQKFVSDKQWPTTVTGTGIHYYIYENGAGETVTSEQVAMVEYEVSLLDGTVIYKSQPGEKVPVKIGHDNVESGLHEAIQLLRIGDRAKFVLPSHRAYGLTGEGKIPMNASVVYDIRLVEIR
jgi:FKBP-type peptidyl-prolyl cis-trans isomerase FkpA